MSEKEMKALIEMKDMLKAENTKLKQKLEEQTKTYQKILQEQQNDIDQLERNCDVFNEQMNDAVERTTELQQEKEELEKKMYLIIMELYSENIINVNIEEMRNILEKVSDIDE